MAAIKFGFERRRGMFWLLVRRNGKSFMVRSSSLTAIERLWDYMDAVEYHEKNNTLWEQVKALLRRPR